MIVPGPITIMTSTADHNRTGLRQFFERYAAASQKKDPEALAAMYASTFIVGGPQGGMSFANDSRFLAWLAQVHDFNETHGMRSLEVISVDGIIVSPRHSTPSPEPRQWQAARLPEGEFPYGEFDLQEVAYNVRE